MNTVQDLVSQFTTDLTTAIQGMITDAIGSVGTSAPAKPGKKRGRPPGSKNKVSANGVSVKKAPAAKPAKARKPSDPKRYLCPVPKCTGKAAPVFGMVCAKHKDLPKGKIKEYRKALAAAKEKAAAKK